MQDFLFTVELPIVNTSEELEKVKAMYPKYDPYFIASGCIRERKGKFEKFWLKFKPYADNNFLTEVKTNFHQKSWEMYLGNVLLERKLSIKSQNEGPDFIVSDNIYIECTAPTKGDSTKPDSVLDMFVAKTPEEIREHNVPVDQMILRITQVIKDKALLQYEKWRSKKWFKKNVPFIIAVNTADLQYVDDPNMPNVIKALFGFQFMQINLKNGKKSYSHRDKIEKVNKEPVFVNYFINDNFSFVSGVLFSDITVLNHPNKIGDDCIFVNNPFASNPVNASFVQFFKHWNASKTHNAIKLKKNYN